MVTESPVEGLEGTVRFDWAALDSWFEEDEQVFVHPRNPYVRVDALRSTRPVRVELDGIVLAESASPVMVFETGLPTRYYVARTEVSFEHLVPSATVTECPYKGTTTGYWSVEAGETVHPDLAWSYDFPTRQLSPIAGMVAFYNEKVDIVLDGVRLERGRDPFLRLRVPEMPELMRRPPIVDSDAVGFTCTAPGSGLIAKLCSRRGPVVGAGCQCRIERPAEPDPSAAARRSR